MAGNIRGHGIGTHARNACRICAGNRVGRPAALIQTIVTINVTSDIPSRQMRCASLTLAPLISVTWLSTTSISSSLAGRR